MDAEQLHHTGILPDVALDTSFGLSKEFLSPFEKTAAHAKFLLERESSIPNREARLLRAVLFDGISSESLCDHLGLAPLSVHHLIGSAATALGVEIGDRKSAHDLLSHFLDPHFGLSEAEQNKIHEGALDGFLRDVLTGIRATPALVSKENYTVLQHYYIDGLTAKEAGVLVNVGVPTAIGRKNYGILQLSQWLEQYGLTKEAIETSLRSIREAKEREAALRTKLTDSERERVKRKNTLRKFLVDSIREGGGKLYPKNRFSAPLKLFYIDGLSYEQVGKETGLSAESAAAVIREGVLHIVNVLREYRVSEKQIRDSLRENRFGKLDPRTKKFACRIEYAKFSGLLGRNISPITVQLEKLKRTSSDEGIFHRLKIVPPHNLSWVVLSTVKNSRGVQLKMEGANGYRRVLDIGDTGETPRLLTGSGQARMYRKTDLTNEFEDLLAREFLGIGRKFEIQKVLDAVQKNPVRASMWIEKNLVPICWDQLTHSELFAQRMFREALATGHYFKIMNEVVQSTLGLATPNLLEQHIASPTIQTNKVTAICMTYNPREFRRKIAAACLRSKDYRKYHTISRLVEENPFAHSDVTPLKVMEYILNQEHVRAALKEISVSGKVKKPSFMLTVATLYPCHLMFSYVQIRTALRGNARNEIVRGFELLDAFLSGSITKSAFDMKNGYRANHSK